MKKLKPKAKPKFLKLLAIVEENYKPISGELKFEENSWHCENVITVKLNDDFTPTLPVEEVGAKFGDFISAVLEEAKERSNE